MIARYNVPNVARNILIGNVYAYVSEETVDRVIVLKKVEEGIYLCKNVDEGGGDEAE